MTQERMQAVSDESAVDLIKIIRSTTLPTRIYVHPLVDVSA